MPASLFRFDVFLSYNCAQKEWTRQLAERLDHLGIKVWLDEWSLRGGTVSSLGLQQGIKDSRHVVLVLSPEFLASGWTSYETQIALLLSPANHDRKIIPIIHSSCVVPELIKRLSWIDFSDTHKDEQRYLYCFVQLLSDLRPDLCERPQNYSRFIVAIQSNSIPLLARLSNQPPEAKPTDKKTLRKLLSAYMPFSTVSTARFRGWVLLVGVFVVLVTTGIFVLRVITRRSQPRNKIKSNVYEQVFRDNAVVDTFTLTCSGRVTAGAISPDGTQVVYAEYEPFNQKLKPNLNQQNLYLKWIDNSTCTDTAKPPQLQGAREPGRYRQIFFSPDGTYYYVYVPNRGTGSLYRTAPGRETVELESHLEGAAVALSRDGKRYAFIRMSENGKTWLATIVIRDVSKGAGYDRAEQILKPQGKWGTHYFDQTLAWSPDGQKLSVLVNNGGWPTANLIAIDIATGEEQLIFAGGEWNQLGRAEWLWDGSGIILEEQDPGSYTQFFAVSYPEGHKRQLM